MGGKSKTSSAACVGMPADFRIADVMDMHRQLRDALNMSPIVLDGTAVDRVDTAALQLLVAFQRDAQKRGHPLSWIGASTPLYDAASQLGLAQTLALPAKTSA
jgi:anti-anti-sigma regulatory factor